MTAAGGGARPSPPATGAPGPAPGDAAPGLGRPRVHVRRIDSTNERARALAVAGAPHGTLVTAGEQTAGRGRQGRTWSAPAGTALLMSLVLRSPPPLLPLAAAVAVAGVCGPAARIKWPNDVLLDGLKVAGILVEGRPLEGWSVLGIGLNLAVEIDSLPVELAGRAGTLGRPAAELEPTLEALLDALGRRLADPPAAVLEAWRERDALLGRGVEWAQGRGTAAGVDGEGRLMVVLDGGGRTALHAGEVHLRR
jgi:BirA family biotin operon repressor/biotin-[acetyl-CoA-carboxylase] ligase